MLTRKIAHLVVVDQLGVLPHSVRDNVEPLTREVDRRPVGEVASMRKAHGQDSVARHCECSVCGDVRTRAAVRLKVCVFGTEERFGSLDADLLGGVDLGAASVITTTRVPLGVLVAECGTQGSQHSR